MSSHPATRSGGATFESPRAGTRTIDSASARCSSRPAAPALLDPAPINPNGPVCPRQRHHCSGATALTHEQRGFVVPAPGQRAID